MDFGTLKNNFTNILIESYFGGNNNGKTLYKKFLKTIKEDDALKSYFIVYKNIESKTITNEVEANEYLKENLSILDKFRGNSSVSFGIKKLIKILKESNTEINNQPNQLHESLYNLLTSPKNVNNIDLIHESKKNVITWLMSDKSTPKGDNNYVVEGINPNKFLEIAVNKFNEKYSNMSEEDKLILSILRDNDTEQMYEVLNILVKENIALINDNLKNYNSNQSLKEKLLETKDMVYNIKEDDTNIGESIIKLLELKETLKED